MNSKRTKHSTKVSSSSSSSVEAFEGSTDLLTEILVRLPAKPLLRLKCVSKRWFSLISSHYFCGRHAAATAATAKVSGMFLRPDEDNLDFQLFSINGRGYHSASPFSSIHPDGMHIYQSCNGLMLGSMRTFDFFIYNPTTKDFKSLPDPIIAIDPSPSSPSPYVSLSLAFDPSFLPSCYTVICVWGTLEEYSSFQAMVYSSEAETQAWRPCGSSFVAPCDMSFDRGVYFNGTVHWICWRNRVSLYYDVSEECMKNNMPPLPEPNQYYVYALTCGYLNLVGDDFYQYINVFRLEKDYSMWVPMQTVDIKLTQLPTTFPEMVYTQICRVYYEYSVLHLLQDESEDSEDDLSLLLQIPGKVIVLHIKDNTFYQIFDLGGPNRNRLSTVGWHRAYGYIESLACVKR